MKKFAPKLKLNISLAEKHSEFNLPRNTAVGQVSVCTHHEAKSDESSQKKAGFAFSPEEVRYHDEKETEVGEAEIQQVCDQLYISNAKAAQDPQVLKKHGITHVINLVAHKFIKSKTFSDFDLNFLKEEQPEVESLNLSIRDRPDADILTAIGKVQEFIDSNKYDEESKFLIF
jgi:hypothetical protein